MSIIIDEKFIATWYVLFPARFGMDWMLGLSHKEGERYSFTYRFRYYKDKKVFDSEDEKSWYSGGGKAKDREAAIAMMREMAELIAQKCGGELHELVRGEGEDTKDFMERLVAMPWAHKAMVH